jgi:predicted phosphodiesterase
VQLGLISDIHGNRTALDAVVADGRTQGVDEWWALGDLVAIGPEPAAVLELLATLPGLQVLRGNTERYVLTGDRPRPHADEVRDDPDLLELFATVSASFAWTRGFLTPTGWNDWLAALPLELRTTLPDGTRLLAAHASPGRDDGEGITPDTTEARLHELLAGADADLVCTGHTHRAASHRAAAVHAVNLGSVSNPITSDLRASYVIVHADDDRTRIEHRRVAYDVDAFLARVDASGHPAADFITSFQRGEQVRHQAWNA